MSSVRMPVSLRETRSSVAVGRLGFTTLGGFAAVCVSVGPTGSLAQTPPAAQPPAPTPPGTSPPPAAPPSTRGNVVLPPLNVQGVPSKPKPPAKSAPAGTQAAVPVQPSQGTPPNANPYADPNAPYKADTLSSLKFTEPLVNTPKSVTVLTKEVLEDKNATTLKEVARTTAGITLGSGEGGNAFGDRFYIRGFDARNDIFIDGVRDPGVSIRENFFVEQVEILRGPGSSFAGRGTTGGAINIVPKQAGDRDFAISETTVGTDGTKRETLDINKAVTSGFAFRFGALLQEANVAGRNYVTDDRRGAFGAVTIKPSDDLKITANYIHTQLSGIPDFGVPYYRPSNLSAGAPFPDVGVNRNNFYGFVNRDFQRATQDIGTVNIEYKFNDAVSISNKFRQQRSVLDYVGTIPESPVITNANPLLWTLSANPQSRYQVTEVTANQTDLKIKFATGDIKNTSIVGVELSQERVGIDSYSGLTSEISNGFSGSGSKTGVNIFNPQFTNLPFGSPSVVGNPLVVPVDTKSAYLLHTANYKDFIIVNGGIRYDDYNVSASNSSGSQSVHSGMSNYNVGIVVKPIPIMSLYAAYATSSNPVGAELDATGSAYGGLPAFVPGNPNQVFGPELNRAAEIGAKFSLFGGHLLFTSALFETWKDNARETATVNGIANTVIAGAAYDIRGIDLGLSGKITEKWSVFGGLVLMESEVTKSNTASANTALYSSNVGLPLANIAHQSFNVLTKYRLTETTEIGGQATYVSKIYGGTFAANQGTELPAHWRFDAFTEQKLNSNLTAKFAVNNILNTTYYDAFYRSAAPFVQIAPGRAAYVVLTAKF